MTQTAREALATAQFVSDGRDYRMLRLSAGAITAAAGAVALVAEPFCALVVDRQEVTLVVPAEALDYLLTRLPLATVAEEVCRLITVDIVVEPELTGLIARISEALAEAGVPILPFASFSRDHIFVPAAQVDDAMIALRRLQGLD